MTKTIIQLLMLTLILRLTFTDHKLNIQRSGRVVGWVQARTEDNKPESLHAIVDVRDCKEKDKNGKTITKELNLVDWEDINDWNWEEIAPSEITKTAETK